MAKHRSHSIEFKRQVAQDFIAGETLHGLAKRHDISRNLIRIWVKKLEAGAFDEDARAADLFRSTKQRSRAFVPVSNVKTFAVCELQIVASLRRHDGRTNAEVGLRGACDIGVDNLRAIVGVINGPNMQWLVKVANHMGQ